MRHLKAREYQIISRATEEAEGASGCSRLSVAAVAVAETNGEYSIAAKAFNGPAYGMRCRSQKGECGCEHAEARVIRELGTRGVVPGRALILLVTCTPCSTCAHAIVNSGYFYRVEWLSEFRSQVGQSVLNASGIQCSTGL